MRGKKEGKIKGGGNEKEKKKESSPRLNHI